jgi:hypothetical protein
MNRRLLTVLCTFVLVATPLVASQGGSKPKSTKPPKPPQTSVSNSVKPTTTKVKPVSAKPTTSKAPKPVKATSAKPVTSTTTATKPAKTKTTTTKAAKAEGKGNKKATTTTATTTTPTETTPTTPAPGETVELTKVQEKLKRNTNLAAKLEQRLGSTVDLMDAADGFRNLGQFVAAVNASYNHEGISFTELKTLMVDDGYSLGQAMQKLKAENATTEARRAETEANRMIETSEREIAAPTGVSATPVPTTTTSSTSSSSSTTTLKAKKKSAKKPVGAQQ